jgi:hypothetical protein
LPQNHRVLHDVRPLAPPVARLDGAGGRAEARRVIDLQDVDLERRASCALDEVHGARQQWSRENRRPRALSAREALAALQFECTLVWAYGKTLLIGQAVSPDDELRVTIAMARINELCDEAIG